MDKQPSRSGRLVISNVSKLYGQARALDGISLTVENGEFLSLLGPSGCGKTTLLRCIAGLVDPDGGSIEVDGRPLDGVQPWKRDISVVFQSYALFPHMSVSDNVAFGLKMRGFGREEIAGRVTEALNLVRMGEYAHRLPAQLSGGQQQRVALARAIVVRPRILLLDEPMAALDAKLRTSVQREIRQLQTTLGITTILVTHDQAEAMTMSDRIAVMNAGGIEQLASPQALYDTPATPFVAEFIGEINRIHGDIEIRDGKAHFISPGYAGLAIPVRNDQPAAPGSATLMVRPEATDIAPVSRAVDTPLMQGTIVDRVQVGDRVFFYLQCSEIELKTVRLATDLGNYALLDRGSEVSVTWDPAALSLFAGHV